MSSKFELVYHGQEMKQQGETQDRLQLLQGISGSFRPGVLTCMMGVSGAGKTTLMDVLAGRKTGGYIEGSITISGYPKRQETFARISGYCEQNDIHSPNLTVHESLLFSSWLRLSADVDDKTRKVKEHLPNKFSRNINKLFVSHYKWEHILCRCLLMRL